VPGLQHIIEVSPGLGTPEWRRNVAALGLTLPFAVWRLWLDRPVHPERQPFVGTAGYPHLDNISVYEKFEAESRRWADSVEGSVVELHAYAVPEDVGEGELRASMLRGLHDLYPETRDASALHEVLRIDRDCPAFPPGGHVGRPGVETPAEGVALAGDFVRLPFPTALMERAAASGFLAANHLLAPWDVRAEPIWSVPLFGPLARRR
jgi:isorenieratene synthase